MAFFEDLGKKISQTGQDAVQKAKDTAEILKLNGMISEEEKRINSIYTEIGKKYFELYGNSCEEVFSGLINDIKASERNVSEYKDQINKLKNLTPCPKCGSQINAGSAFCTSCGARMSQPDKKLCPNCGNDTNGTAFCTRCGAKVDSSPIIPPTVNPAPATTTETSAPKILPPVIPTAPTIAPATNPATPSIRLCSNCGAILDKNSVFCTKCGIKYEQPSAPIAAQPKGNCTNCGTELQPNAAFCTKCGTKI